MPFRIVGYSPDSDGSLMAELQSIDRQGDSTGSVVRNVTLYPDVALALRDRAELSGLFEDDEDE